ncbi:MAG TPA: hypothetical protein VFZ61_18825 [Polyangiales bacterium]
MRHVLPVFTLSLPFILACAAEERGDNASVTDALSLWARYAELACQKARGCCDQEGFSTNALADCETDLVRQTGVDQLIRFVGDESVTMNRALFTRCLEEGQKQLDQCVTPSPIEACVDSIRGALAEGDACESSIQCSNREGSALCLRVVAEEADVTDTTPGICHNQVRGKPGDACVHTCEDPPCLLRLTTREQPEGTAFCFWEDGLYCDRSQDRCAQLVETGQECSSSEACGRDAYCNDDGVCQRRAQAGAQCEFDDECAGSLLCADSAGTCEQASPFDEDFCTGDFD